MGLLQDNPVENNIRMRSNNYTCHSPPNHDCRRNLEQDGFSLPEAKAEMKIWREMVG